jgi:hypothetical protein
LSGMEADFRFIYKVFMKDSIIKSALEIQPRIG